MAKIDISDLVLSKEQMKRLNNLGFNTNNTAMCWVRKMDGNEWRIMPNPHYDVYGFEFIPTLTLQEILLLLPPQWNRQTIKKYKDGTKMTFGETLVINRCTKAGSSDTFYCYSYGNNILSGVTDDNPLIGAFLMLVRALKENKIEQLTNEETKDTE